MAHKKVLDDICEDCSVDYCTLKEIMLHDAKYSDRLIVQAKCVDKFKYEESERQGKDIEWQGAWEQWVKDGYAKRFSQMYDESMSFRQIYKLTTSKD